MASPWELKEIIKCSKNILIKVSVNCDNLSRRAAQTHIIGQGRNYYFISHFLRL